MHQSYKQTLDDKKIKNNQESVMEKISYDKIQKEKIDLRHQILKKAYIKFTQKNVFNKNLNFFKFMITFIAFFTIFMGVNAETSKIILDVKGQGKVPILGDDYSGDTPKQVNVNGNKVTLNDIYVDTDKESNVIELQFEDEIKDISELFKNRDNINKIDLSNFDSSSVKSMNQMFSGCNALTSLNLSSIDTSSVTDMGGMFKGCKSLTSLDLSGFKTLNVQKMNDMFSECNNITSLNLSNLITSQVKEMSQMFSGCKSLTSLDLSSFNTQNVENMHRMFYNCNSLKSLKQNFNTSKVNDMTQMFCYCPVSKDTSKFTSDAWCETPKTSSSWSKFWLVIIVILLVLTIIFIAFLAIKLKALNREIALNKSINNTNSPLVH